MWIYTCIVIVVSIAAGFVVGFCLGIDFEKKNIILRSNSNERL